MEYKKVPFTEIVIKEFPRRKVRETSERTVYERYRLLKRKHEQVAASGIFFDIRICKETEKGTFLTETGISIPISEIPTLVKYLQESLNLLNQEKGRQYGVRTGTGSQDSFNT